MIDSKYRNKYQTLVLNPLLKNRFVLQMAPCQITLVGLLFGILSAILVATNHPYQAFCFLALSGLCDTLDGALARVKRCESDKGAVLDITSDRFVEFAIIMGLYFVNPVGRATNALLMLGAVLLCITSFLVVGIFSSKHSEKSFFYSPGMMERSEAFAFFTLMILFPFLYPFLAPVFTLLVSWTGIRRVYEFYYS